MQNHDQAEWVGHCDQAEWVGHCDQAEPAGHCDRIALASHCDRAEPVDSVLLPDSPQAVGRQD
jgi:hypothetical protein